MTARLELNPIRYVSWKGKTFNQITASIKKNTYELNTDDTTNIFHPTPVKMYRKEIASTANNRGNSRISSSIQDFERPNGYLIASPINSNGDCISLNNTLDITIPDSSYETGKAIELSSNPTVCFSQAANALSLIHI